MKKFLKNKLAVMTFLAMTSLSLIACNDDNDSVIIKPDVDVEAPTDEGTPTQGQKNTLSGKLVSYDGQTPLANALVYVTKSPNGIMSRLMVQSSGSTFLNTKLECGVAPDNVLASTCTSADGSYTLNVQTEATELVVKFEKGAFTAEQNVTLKMGSDSTQVVLTQLGNTVLQNIPKMLVVQGAYDSIELILARLELANTSSGEITDAKFDLWPSTDNLFIDSDNNGKADIFDYELVFFNCGQEDLDWLLDESKRQILRDYVSLGGRIYVSDLSYDIVEQVFPEYINFYGSDSTEVNQPEDIGAANNGESGISIKSTVEPVLQSWLKGVTCAQGSCLNADGTVTIKGFSSGWAQMNSVSNDKKVDIYASGQDSDGAMRPLTVAFDYNEGRVTYTSYHNDESDDDCYEDSDENSQCATNEGISVQQRILQYLIFEL